MPYYELHDCQSKKLCSQEESDKIKLLNIAFLPYQDQQKGKMEERKTRMNDTRVDIPHKINFKRKIFVCSIVFAKENISADLQMSD